MPISNEELTFQETMSILSEYRLNADIQSMRELFGNQPERYLQAKLDYLKDDFLNFYLFLETDVRNRLFALLPKF